jgi:LruC domain-containing protein
MKRILTITLMLLISGSLLFQTGCQKKISDDPTVIPTKFTELKIDPAFKFENFSNLGTSIQLSNNKASGVEIIQIYDAHPNNGGKLILTGAANQDGLFNLPVRIASRLKEVYVAKLSSIGANEYVAVPVTGSTIQFNFAGSQSNKEAYAGCDNTLANGHNGDLTIPSGKTWCVAAGNFATIVNLKIGNGGTLNVYGTATVNKYKDDTDQGKIIVSPGGALTLPKHDLKYTLENYGTLNFTGSGDCQLNGNFHNWGSVISTIKLTNQGSIVNDGTFTTYQDFINNSEGTIINNCNFYVIQQGSHKSNDNSHNFKQNANFTNNGYMVVNGEANFTGSGNKQTTLGKGSLIDCGDFKIEGKIVGPGSQGSQITATDDSKTSGGSDISGYVDLWVKNGNDISPNQGTKGSHVTYHAYTITAPTCSANTAPVITSSQQIGGLKNQAITPYVMTATGTAPITYNVTGLPAGLTFNASTQIISGTVATVGTYHATMTATNFMGTDTKPLDIIISEPPAPPVITSVLTAQVTVNQTFNYTLTATGTGPITYSVDNLPDGLSFDPATQVISGSPTTAGNYNINLYAANAAGTANEVLVLTVGTPPSITSSLTANGTTDVQFATYTFTADGSPTIVYSVAGLPESLSFNPSTREINGTPSYSGVFPITLTATNEYGTDVKTLVLTIVEGAQPPVITSSLIAFGVRDFPFTYTMEATGSQPMTFSIDETKLPAGMTFSGGVISGIPTEIGVFSIPMTAHNNVADDNKTLVLTIAAGSGTDTDGDLIPDNIDAYPTDPTRAFNSYYPNEVEYVSVAFEDLWPGKGDYDFNDFVVNLNYKMVTNAQNKMVDVILKYQIMADGASLDNGFGLVFDAEPGTVESVLGCIKLGNAVSIDPKGFEAGHTNQTVIIPIDNINPIMEGGLANTIVGGKYVQTTVQTVTTHFGTPQASIGAPPYNPFIFVDQVRGHEVHLKDKPPTEFVDNALFGTWLDASDPAKGFYYRSTTGLPWGIETPVNFNYPIELADILTVHLKFAAWAQSSGVDYPDWYMNKTGYRDATKIYVIPQP